MDPAERRAKGEIITPKVVLDEFSMEPHAACNRCSWALRVPVWLPCKHVFCKLCSEMLNIAGTTNVKCSKCLRVFASTKMKKDRSLLAAYTRLFDESSVLELNPELEERSTTESRAPAKALKRPLPADNTEPDATKHRRGKPKKQCLATVTSAAGLAQTFTPTHIMKEDNSVSNLPVESPCTKVGSWLRKSVELEESPLPFQQPFKGKNEKIPKPRSAAKGSGIEDCSDQQQDLLLSDSGIQSDDLPGKSMLKGLQSQSKAGPSGLQNVSAFSGDQSPGWSRVRRASREIRRNEQTLKSLDISGGESSKNTGITKSIQKIGRPKRIGVAKGMVQKKVTTVSKKAAQEIATSACEMAGNILTSNTLDVSAIETAKPSSLAKSTEKVGGNKPKTCADDLPHGKAMAGSSKTPREIASHDGKPSEDEENFEALNVSGKESCKSSTRAKNAKKVGGKKLKAVASKTPREIASSDGKLSDDEETFEALNVSTVESHKSSALGKNTEKFGRKKFKAGAEDLPQDKAMTAPSKTLQEIASSDGKPSEDEETFDALNISGKDSLKFSTFAKNTRKYGRKKFKAGAEDAPQGKAMKGASKTPREVASCDGKPSDGEETIEALNVSSVESHKSLAKVGRKKLKTIPGKGTQEISAAGREISENNETLNVTNTTKRIGHKNLKAGKKTEVREKIVADSSRTAPGIVTSDGELSENEQTLVAQNESSQESCRSVGYAKKTKKTELKTLEADDVNAVKITRKANSGKPAKEATTTEGVKSKSKTTNLKPTRSLRARKGQEKDLETSKHEIKCQNANPTEPTGVKSSQSTKQTETVKFVKELIANTSSKNSVEIVARALRSYEFNSDSDSLGEDGLRSDMLLAMEHQTSADRSINPHRVSDPISEGDRDFPGFPSFEQNEITLEQPSLNLPLVDTVLCVNNSKGALVQEDDQEAPLAITKSSGRKKIANRSNVSALKTVPNDTKRKTFSLDVNTQDLAFIRVNEDSFDKRIHEIANANKCIKMPTEAASNVLKNVTNSPTKLASKIIASKDKIDISPGPKLSWDSTQNPSDDDLIEQFRCFLNNKSESKKPPGKDLSLTDFRDLRPFFVAYEGPFLTSTGEPIPGKRVFVELDPCSITQLKILQNPALTNADSLLLDEKSPLAGTKGIAEMSDTSDNENLQSMVAVDPSDRHPKKKSDLVNNTPSGISIAEKEVNKSLVAGKGKAKQKVTLEVSDNDSFPNTIPDTMPSNVFCGKVTSRPKPPTTDFPRHVSQLPEAHVGINETDLNVKSEGAKVKKSQPKSRDKPYPPRRKQTRNHPNTKASVPKLTDPQASGTHNDDMHIDDKSKTSKKRRFNRIRTPSDSNEFEDAIPDPDIFSNDFDLPNRMSDEEPDSLEYLLDAHCRNIPSPETGTIDIVPIITKKSQDLVVKVATPKARAVSSPQTPDSFVNVLRMIASSDKAIAASAIPFEDTNSMAVDNDITHMEESPVRRHQAEGMEDDDDDSEDICKPTPEAVNRSKIVRRPLAQKPQPPFPDMMANTISEPETESAEVAHIISTSLSLEDTKLMIQMIKMVGAIKQSTFSEDTTHLVAATSDDGCAQRTAKFIMALASGAWVVSPSWVHECFETGSLVSESSYEARDFVFGDSPRRSRLGGGRVFRDFAFFLMPPYAGQIEESEFKMILQLAGAAVVNNPSDKGNKKYLVTLTVQEDSPEQTMMNERFMKKHNSLVVAYSWVHNCICSYLLRSVWTHLPDDADVSQKIRQGYPPQIFAPPTDSDDESDA